MDSRIWYLKISKRLLEAKDQKGIQNHQVMVSASNRETKNMSSGSIHGNNCPVAK